MGFKELIDGLQRGAQDSSLEFLVGLAAFRAKITQENVIRFYVDGTPNFGHQATTVHLIKRFVEIFDYGKTVEVHYAKEPRGVTPTTIQKLALLFTGLDPVTIQPIRYNNATILFIQYDDQRQPDTEYTFGFTGGADSAATNFARNLNVKYFLRLQPYNWRPGGRNADFIPNGIEFKDGRQPVGLTQVSRVFGAIPYAYDPGKVANVPNEVWTWYSVTQTFDAALKQRVLNCKALVDACVAKGNVRIWPAYGMHHFENGKTALLNTVLAGILHQRNDPNHSPIVLTLINDGLDFQYINALQQGNIPALTGLFETELNAPLATSITAAAQRLRAIKTRGGPTTTQQAEAQERLARSLLEEINGYEQSKIDNSISINRFRDTLSHILRGINFTQVLKIIPTAVINPAAIGGTIGGLNQGEIAVIPVGSQPQEIFNYLYGVARMPCIFEGQGTSSLVISLGKPYFQMNKRGNDNVNYPEVPVVEQPRGGLNQEIQARSNLLRDTLYGRIGVDLDYVGKIRAIAEIIDGIYTANSPAQTYFARLREAFQLPTNDKFQLGLVALNTFGVPVVGSSPPKLDPDKSSHVGEPLTIDGIYAALIASWSNGQIDLFTALPDSRLKAYYSTIVGETFVVNVAKEDIVKEAEKVSIQDATTDSFQSIVQTGFQFQLVFSLDHDVIISDMKCKCDTTWNIADIPWLEFSDPGFEMKVFESAFPVQGGASGLLKSADLKLNFDYPVENDTWVLTGTFESPFPSIGKFYQMAGGVNLVESLPAPLNSIAGFGLKKAQLVYNTATNKLDYILFEMGTPEPWTILENPKFEVTPFVQAVISDPASLKNRSVSFTIGGQLVIGGGTINVAGRFPNFQVHTELIEGEIDLGELSEKFGLPVLFQSSITSFDMLVVPEDHYFKLNAEIKDLFTIKVFDIDFSMTNLLFEVEGSSGDFSTKMAGKIAILPETENYILDIILSYNKYLDWTFSAALTSGEVQIASLLQEYLGWETGQEYGIDGLALTLAMKPRSFEFSGKTAAPWHIEFLDMDISGSIRIGYLSKPPGSSSTLQSSNVPITLRAQETNSGVYGEITAEIQWHGITIDVFYNFNPDYKAFGIQWGNLFAKIEQKVIKEKPCEVASLRFTEPTTLGDVVATMIGWATGSDFGLGAPWNVLDSIPLNDLELGFNFTDKTVSLEVAIGPIEIGVLGINVAEVTGISLDYSSEEGVQVGLEGTFHWQEDTTQKLGWDATKPESTPGPPAMGNKYIDLRMLAMGQHVKVEGLPEAKNIKQAIQVMESLPEPEPGKTPPVTLDSNRGWLLGLDMGLLRIGEDTPPQSPVHTSQSLEDQAGEYVFNLQVVFNDPDLYGLRISTKGKAARVFKGLEFEVAYRKVSESVGVYQSEIILPDAMRYMKIGQFNITLPVFGIEIYTNGDFKVDLGFPWNADFSRSFTFQTILFVGVPIPVTGAIGIYFGKLSSATSTSVPATDKGIFNPVVVFGVGIQFGLGYDFNAGILSAGFRLTATAIIEGVIAKWNPYLPDQAGGNDDRLEESYYYSLRGTIGLIGKLYGSVDFAIVKASINIDIRVLVQLVFAPYDPIELSIAASLTASASLEIDLGLFSISIHFSFAVEVQEHITLPATGSNPPWGDGVHQPLDRWYMLQRVARQERLMHRLLFAKMTPDWDNLEASTAPSELTAYLTLGLTMAQDENQATPTLEAQQACYTAMLMIESVRAPQLDQDSCKIKSEDPEQDSSFENLSKEIFRWAVAATGTEKVTSEDVDQSTVSSEELASLLDYLSDQSNPFPIPLTTIEQFMAGQFVLQVNAPPEADGTIDATCFPMVPSLAFHVPSYGSEYAELGYAYAEYNSISDSYINELRKYFDQLAVKVEGKDYDAVKLAETKGISIASFVFADYFSLIARQMVQMAINSLKNYTYAIKPDDSPALIVNWINEQGQLAGEQAFTIEQLFENNSTHPLNEGKSIQVDGVIYTILAGDTFKNIAEKGIFGSTTAAEVAKFNEQVSGLLCAGVSITYPQKPDHITLPGESLADISIVFKVDIDQLLADSNVLEASALLVPAASLNIPSFAHQTNKGDMLSGISSQYGVSIKSLAENEANSGIVDLFQSGESEYLNVVQLAQFKVEELIKEIQRTQGLQHLAGMTSRYYMAGLRLPTKGITPDYSGMWVTGEEGAYKLPDMAGLYALTGQQFPVPELIEKEPFNVQFSSDQEWLQLKPTLEDSASTESTELSIKIIAESIQAKQIKSLKDFATKNYLDTGLTKIGSQPLFSSQPATYTFHSAIPWASPSIVSMPFASSVDGLQDLRVWKLPDSLAKLPNLSKHKINPQMSIKLGRYDQATQTLKSEGMTSYGLGSRIEFTIKKVAEVPDSPATKTTYEVMGADGQNVAILEAMLSRLGTNNDAIQGLHLAYTQSDDSNGNVSIQTDDAEKLTVGLSQVNLSTETRPPEGSSMENNLKLQKGVWLNGSIEFIRLLWQASITRAGGYYLYYYNSESKTGFPDRIFNNEGDAKISVVILYSPVVSEITSYMNALVTSKAVNFSNHTLFAESVPQSCPLPTDNTIADIVQQYYANVKDIAEVTQHAILQAGLKITISNGVYQVGIKEPKGGLQGIAAHFEISLDDLKAANPKITEWSDPLPLFTAIFLPDLTVTVGESPGGITLESIASYYGLSVAFLAGINQNLQGLLTNAKGLTFLSGPTQVKANVAQNVSAIEASRPVPAKMPEDPAAAGYAEIYLKNNFSLLACRVEDNPFFKSSTYGLPMTPGTSRPVTKPNGHEKFGLPPILVEGDDWEFKVTLPYNKFIKSFGQTSDGHLPAPHESPYVGIGNLLQASFAWQDVYGNRLLSTLEHPDQSSPLNKPPVLMEYTDQLISLSQWPSVTSSWMVNEESEKAQLQILLNFDSGIYDGLWSAKIDSESGHLIVAEFTTRLEATSANNIQNYQLPEGIGIESVELQGDQKTVHITVKESLSDGNLTLQVKGIISTGEQVYNGSATFNHDGPVTSTLKNEVLASLSKYRELWYQLTDPGGVDLAIQTTLLTNPDIPLNSNQVQELVHIWLSSIYLFLDDRSKGKPSAQPPSPLFKLTFLLEDSEIIADDIFKLETCFFITRKRNDLIGNYAYSNDLLSSRTIVAPSTEVKDGTQSLTGFATNFENALSTDDYQLSIANGVDRSDQHLGANSALWGIRLKKTGNTGIGFDVSASEPFLFAPKPVSNQLISRTGIPIKLYNSKTGLGPGSTLRDFIDVDLDLWCRQLFEAIDHLLTPAFVSSIQLIDKTKDQQYLKSLQQNKEDFAEIIKFMMVPVFKGETVDGSVIQDQFKQNLLVRLSNAYNVQAGIQYSVDVQTNIKLPSPRLYGNLSQRSGIEQVGGITMTSPKLSIENQNNIPMSFLLSSAEVVRGEGKEVVSHLSLELDYQGTNFEHQIDELPGISGYEASSWLRFINPDSAELLKAELPTTTVPVPLRAFPTSPRMARQNGHLADDTSVQKLLLWDYRFVYSQAFHYPQDQLHFEVKSNLKPVGNSGAIENTDLQNPDLKNAFSQIAQFITVYPELEQGLFKVAEIDVTTSTTSETFQEAEIALSAFSQLLSDVCNHARIGNYDNMEGGEEGESYAFTIQEGSTTIEETEHVLLVSVDGKTPEGYGSLNVQIAGYETHTYDHPESDYSFYFRKSNSGEEALLLAAEGQLIPERTIILAGLNVLARQDISTTVSIERNPELVPGRLTNPDFVYSTGKVGFANYYFPSFRHDRDVNIAALATGKAVKATLEMQFQHLFEALLAENKQTLLSFSLVTAYEYAVNALQNTIELPIMMQSIKSFELDDPQKAPLEMLDPWVKGIYDWLSENTPQKTDAKLLFGLTIFSNLTKEPKPLIQLSNLYLDLSDIV
ncbi:MAG: hypothetical protein RIM99_14425 [Cyclobacteriaceae bacterium]